ncbi:hypothetical protein Nepgr_013508 [Nepenthes gracilis]|uniref:Uncharacterized protein n=1 Tax=Nepenthes gracilis TaxID=150966 RepID=A0AAD3XNQ9_NEPGR|nr:hypothetical protein Nepgr_013508 [Nepenthes gracilis]
MSELVAVLEWHGAGVALANISLWVILGGSILKSEVLFPVVLLEFGLADSLGYFMNPNWLLSCFLRLTKCSNAKPVVFAGAEVGFPPDQLPSAWIQDIKPAAENLSLVFNRPLQRQQNISSNRIFQEYPPDQLDQ